MKIALADPEVSQEAFGNAKRTNLLFSFLPVKSVAFDRILILTGGDEDTGQ